MTKVLFGTPTILNNYIGTCLKCGGPLRFGTLRCVFTGERGGVSKSFKVMSLVFCPTCKGRLTGVELFESEWTPDMFAWSN